MRKVVREINTDLGTIHSFRLECLMWEDLSSRISLRPQEAISRAFESFEIYLGLMGFYFGTPTGDFGSGTEEEYYSALDQWKSGRLNYIQFYFSSAKVDSDLLDLDQVQKVRNFRKSIGGDGVLYQKFTDLNVLEARVRSALISDSYKILNEPNIQPAANDVLGYNNLNPYGNMKSLNRLMAQRPETAISFLAHAGSTSLEAATAALSKITRNMTSVARKANSFSRLAADVHKGKGKERTAIKHLEQLYAGVESLLRAFASETPRLDHGFSNAISSFHRAAEIAANLSERDYKDVRATLDSLRHLKSVMEATSEQFGDLAMPEVPELGTRWEVGRLTLDAVVSDFRDFIARGVNAIDVVLDALSERKVVSLASQDQDQNKGTASAGKPSV